MISGNVKIIYEDEELLVIEKPFGLVVNRADSTKSQTLQEILEEYFRYEQLGGPGKRAGIVHRLDKDTSGVMLVAKSENSMANLQLQFKNREVTKIYTALTHGFTKKEFKVTLSLARSKANRLRYSTNKDGRQAETGFVTKAYYQVNPEESLVIKKRLSKDFWTSYDRFSLVEAYPKTGRTHQIRVHLHSVFAPIVSDEIYGGRKWLRVDRLWAERMFLHASKISFKHPKSGKVVEFASELPSSLQGILSKLVKVEV